MTQIATEQTKIAADYTPSKATKTVATELMKMACDKGRMAFSVSRDMREAADKLSNGNLEFCTGALESFLSRSDVQTLANMQREFNLMQKLLWNAVVNDESLPAHERVDYCECVMAEAEAAFAEYARA